jgi:hypothetical protein
VRGITARAQAKKTAEPGEFQDESFGSSMNKPTNPLISDTPHPLNRLISPRLEKRIQSAVRITGRVLSTG